jgi:RluA family pseudouridine synthase
MKRKAAIRIGLHEAGMPVLELLSRRFSYHDRTTWAQLIHSQKILLNDRPTLPTALLSVGDMLEYLVDGNSEPPVDTRFSILFEDDFLLVVEKPGDLPCHPSGRYFEHTLWAILKKKLSLPYLTFVNRIDRESSGIVLLAKRPEAARACQEQFKYRRVYKRYAVIVEGPFPSGEVKARGYLTAHPQSLIRKKLRFYPAGTSNAAPLKGLVCSTIFRKIVEEKGLSLLEAIPVTGRSHQIRATLHSLGYPVVGDKIYGLDEKIFLRFISGCLNPSDKKSLRLPRQALHAAELHFSHPETGKRLKFKSPLSPEMGRLINV